MKVLIINASHRHGNTDLAVEMVKKSFAGKMSGVRELKLREIEMKLPDGCEVCAEGGVCPNVKDQFSAEIEPTIRDYDIYLLATPTWSDGITPLAKIFWDQIVSWCGEEKIYLRGKKLAVLTHGMAGKQSWSHVVDWVKSVCRWEKAEFGGSLTFKSGVKVGKIELTYDQAELFVNKLLG